MDKEKWRSMTDDEKTSYMRNVFKDMRLGDNFDYGDCRRIFEETKGYGVYQNPCLVLELVDPIMAHFVMDWMYSFYDDEGNSAPSTLPGATHAPLFGYRLVSLYFDKSSLMNFSDWEKDIINKALSILKDRVK